MADRYRGCVQLAITRLMPHARLVTCGLGKRPQRPMGAGAGASFSDPAEDRPLRARENTKRGARVPNIGRCGSGSGGGRAPSPICGSGGLPRAALKEAPAPERCGTLGQSAVTTALSGSNRQSARGHRKNLQRERPFLGEVYKIAWTRWRQFGKQAGEVCAIGAPLNRWYFSPF